jgi:predicted RNA-binding protein YlxR (DUF448 family)
VHGPQGVQVDPTGKLAGRGAYLHDQRSCWEKGLKGALAHALKVELSVEEQRSLAAFAETLTASNDPAAISAGPYSQETPTV